MFYYLVANKVRKQRHLSQMPQIGSYIRENKAFRPDCRAMEIGPGVNYPQQNENFGCQQPYTGPVDSAGIMMYLEVSQGRGGP
jgi:hypothetical protein